MNKSKEERLFMEFCRSVAEESTCARVHVGAVITKDGHVISHGYNGVPSKKTHCKDYMKKVARDQGFDDIPSMINSIGMEEYKKIHAEYSRFEIHAEMNAIAFASKRCMSLEGTTLYTTVSPCFDCARLIVAVGISRVIYLEPYDRGIESLDYLSSNGVIVECYQVEKMTRI